MEKIDREQILRHIARSDLTAIEKRYLEGLTNRDKTAQWDYMDAIEPDEDGNGQAYCTNCHTGDTHAIQRVGDVPYCWKCGARMTGVITSTAMVFVDDAAPIKICDCRYAVSYCRDNDRIFACAKKSDFRNGKFLLAQEDADCLNRDGGDQNA